MIDPNQWRLPVRRVDSTSKSQGLHSATTGTSDPRGAPWSKEMTIERFQDKLFGGIGCIEYSQPNSNNNTNTTANASSRFLAISARSQSLVMRLPFRNAQDSALASTSNCVWNEQLPRACFTTRFRGDEKLAVQTIDQRILVRSTETAFERTFDGHTRDVRDAMFLTGQIIVSVSDDATVRLWSLTQNNEVAVSQGAHTDYIRTLCALNDRQFVTGSYDRNIFLWDVRSSDMRSPVMSFRVGHPVEKVVANGLFAPHSIYASAADVVMMFDIRKGSMNTTATASENQQQNSNSALVTSASFHTKTVTALALHCDSNHNITVLTGGLDKRIKIHRQEGDGSFTTIAARKAQAGISALAVHPDGNQFAIGTSDGYCSVCDVNVEGFSVLSASKSKNNDELLPGISASKNNNQQQQDEVVQADRGVAGQSKNISAIKESAAAVRKERAIASWLRRIQALLARFRYGLALKTALYAKFPDVLVTTLDELQRRCVLHVAISGHDDRTIVQLLRFAVEHVSDARLTTTCLTVMNRIFEIYAPVASESEHFLRELLKAHHVMEEMSADVEHIRASTAILELLVQ